MKKLRPRLTFANVVSCLALFLALGGGAYAATQLKKNSVGTKQLKKDSVTSSKVKDGSLEARDFKAGSLQVGPRGEIGPPGSTVSAGAIAASVTNVAPQNAESSHSPALEFDTEEFDTDGLHSGDGPRLTAPVDGLYEVAATVSFAANSMGFRQLVVAVNESEVSPPAIATVSAVPAPASTNLSASGLVSLKAGEYVVAEVEQTSGSTLAIEGTEDARGPRLSMFRVGPLS